MQDKCVLPRVKNTAKENDGSQSCDNFLVALCPGVEGKHTHFGAHTISLQDWK